MAQTKSLNFRATEEEVNRLAQLARRFKMSKSEVIRKLLLSLEAEVGPQLHDEVKESIAT